MEENIDLDYLEISLAELDKSYQFYFDSVDIVRIIQGINRFYDKESGQNPVFNEVGFEKNETIVHCLTMGGFLGKGIKLLPPHQAELAKIIKASHGGDSSVFFKISENILQSFLEKDVEFFTKLTEITTHEDLHPNDTFINNWIEDKAKELFKTIYYSYHADYGKRFTDIFNKQIVVTEKYSVADIEITDYELFKVLSDIFRTIRPGKEDGWSNSNDVAAFMYLARKVQEFNQDNTLPIPVFFDSNNYSDSFPQSVLDKYFCLHLKNEVKGSTSKSSTFRKWNFFQLHALLNFHKTTISTSDDNQYTKFAETKNYINQLQHHVSKRNKETEFQNLEDLYDELNVENVGKEIRAYITVDFYRTIITNIFVSKIEIVNSILLDFKKDTLNPDSAEIVKIQGDIIMEFMTDKMNDIWEEIAIIFQNIEKTLKQVISLNIMLDERGTELDVFHHYSLFRFFIPKEYRVIIKHLFSKDGLLSDDPETARDAKWTLWFSYRTLYIKSIEAKGLIHKTGMVEGELYILFSTFWILSLHHKISCFPFDEKYLQELSHSLLMLIAASIDRAISETNEDDTSMDIETQLSTYKKIINILQNRLGLSTDEVQAQIKIVLAYLYFHLWQQEGNKLILDRPFFDDHEIEYNPTTANYKAINFAKEAYDFYAGKNEKNNPYLLYSLNIYIYYVIESAPTELFRSIYRLMPDFIRLKDSVKKWSFRYDDTIVRNLHRTAKVLSKKEQKLDYISNSIKLLEQTLDKTKMLEGRDIKEVRTYFGLLLQIKSEIDLKQDSEINFIG